MAKKSSIEKRFYRTSEVAEIVGVPASTLRFWEKEFPQLEPKRSRTGLRLYTPETMRRVEMIHYLVHIKGLKIDAARKVLQKDLREENRAVRTRAHFEGPSPVASGSLNREIAVTERLLAIRSRLQALIEAIRP